MGRPATDKRERLVRAARGAFHRRGVAGASLAEVARQAGVPAGNSFYYFRSKDELARAVVEDWCAHLVAVLNELDQQQSDPCSRIHSFLDRAADNRSEYAANGCPIAGLSRDLRLQGGGMGSAIVRAYELQLRWLAHQFQAAGTAEAAATSSAQFLLAGLQGSFVLGHAARSEKIIQGTIDQLKSWLNDHCSRAATDR